MTLNEKKGNYIANNLGLQHGVIVNSGTIAILSALKILNIKPGDYVLINGYCCYSLFEAIETIGAIPLLYVPENFYNISFKEIKEILNKYDVKCYIATHQYGIVQDIKDVKEQFPNLKIIEDVAQGWNIINGKEEIGKYSDLVVSSFGKTKPLSYGQAGIVMSNNNLHEYFDFHDRESRNSNKPLLPFALYECENINEIELVENANEIIKHQREVAKYLLKYFKDNQNLIVHKDKRNNKSCYQRYPIIIKDLNYLKEIEELLNENNILYQLQNELEVWELDMVKNSNAEIIQNVEKPKYVLVRTRQNNIEDVKRLVKKL